MLFFIFFRIWNCQNWQLIQLMPLFVILWILHYHIQYFSPKIQFITRNPLSHSGREFVRQYYTLLNKAPLHLGQQEIHQKIKQLNFRDCKVCTFVIFFVYIFPSFCLHFVQQLFVYYFRPKFVKSMPTPLWHLE